jgi:hypothetical protein
MIKTKIGVGDIYAQAKQKEGSSVLHKTFVEGGGDSIYYNIINEKEVIA